MVPFLATIFGLPVHPLVVHAAVVLVPLAAIAHTATGWRSSWRRAYAIPTALVAAGGALFALVAKTTGESLERTIREAARTAGARVRFGDHPEQGDAAFAWAFILAVAVAAFAALTLWERRQTLPRWLMFAAWAGVAVIGVAATATMVAAGHSGAALVWNEVGTFAGSR